MENEVRGYKPQVLMQSLGLPKERFRYWRAHLDPNPHRTHFTFSDFIAYRIMKTLIVDGWVEVKFLSQIDWSVLFKTLAQTHYKDLKKMVVVISVKPINMTLEYVDDVTDRHGKMVSFIYLEQLVEEQISAFVDLGAQNVVSINHAKKA